MTRCQVYKCENKATVKDWCAYHAPDGELVRKLAKLPDYSKHGRLPR